MTTEIVKVQIPIMPPNGPALIYAEGRDRAVEVSQRALPRRVRHDLRESHKGFYKARWNGAGWMLGKPAAEQSW